MFLMQKHHFTIMYRIKYYVNDFACLVLFGKFPLFWIFIWKLLEEGRIEDRKKETERGGKNDYFCIFSGNISVS